MRWLFGIIGAALGQLAGVEGVVLGFAGGALIGWALEREKLRARYLATQDRAGGDTSTEAQLRALTERVTRLEQALATLATPALAEMADPDAEHVPAASPPSAAVPAPISQPATATPMPPAAVPSQPSFAAAHPPQPPQAATPASPRLQDAAARATTALKALLFGGNTVVRIGVLILIIGVGLLARYAAEQSYFPLQLRLAFAGGLGVALIIVGFKLREGRPGFSTALQGGGVAALYLVIFFAHHRYALLPAPLTLAVLVAIAALSSLLAVAQNAAQLAVFGAIGGFLAPLLASRGEDDHVTLFAYYALLNAAIAGIALFRSWRVLNWVGFAFTFGIASAWGVLRYEPAHLITAGSFLALFFAFYLLNGTLFALRQPEARRGVIDTTLTFGTPLATLGLAAGLLREIPIQLALACVLIAGCYLGVARFLLSRHDLALRPLAQAYVAIGIGAGTIAIPLAVEDALATALAWAVEAGGLIWVGRTQQRLRTRIAGVLLFAASLVALLSRIEQARPGGRALFLALLALCFLFGAAQLERLGPHARRGERGVSHALLGVSLSLWLAATEATCTLLADAWHDLVFLSLLAVSLLGLDAAGSRARFGSAASVARFGFAFLLLYLPSTLASPLHPFAHLAWLGWLAGIAASLSVLHRQRAPLDGADAHRLRDALHASGALLLSGLLALEVHAVTADLLGLAEGWVLASTLVAALLVPGLALAARPAWPLAAYPRAYLAWSSWPITLLVCAAALLAQLDNAASPAPLPHLPLLNPLDLAHTLALVVLLVLARTPTLRSTRGARSALASFALSLFVLLNGSLVRTAHHWFGVPMSSGALLESPGVQAAFSILWTVLALIAMLLGHRRGVRAAWLTGASLIGIVVIKLFSLDLAQLGSVAKIVTFLAVGLLLLLIGYVAPVPPAAPRESAQ